MTGPNGRPMELNGLVHLSETEVAGYLDHDLSGDERRRVETHIDQCATCRREVVALLPITQPDQPHQRAHHPKRWWIPAAAAAVFVALTIPRLTRNAPDPDIRQRARPVSDAGGRSRLAIVTPADDATVAGRVVFAWRSADADVYRVSLLTENGDPVWTSETGDTTVALPDSVRLQASQAYFWRVEAIGNGIAATTGVHRLQTPRE